MENIRELDCWEDFKKEVESQDIEEAQSKEAAANLLGHRSPILFRGQSNSERELLTTLDRKQKEPFRLKDYLRLVMSIRAEVETFTDHQWTVPSFDELASAFEDYDSFMFEFPAYDYLVYLRHHGFPSPLLDWSASPYVAAYFAFCNKTDAENVAIYRYQEMAGAGKIFSSDEPQIKALGPRVKSHPRHFIQQSHYTICANYQNDGWSYCPHEDVFKLARPNQDRLTKYVLPASERPKVLSNLNQYNINAFSLFQDEESLLKTLSLREFDLNRI
jgi:hypothetical protein